MKCIMAAYELDASWNDKPFEKEEEHIYISPLVDNSGAKTVCAKCFEHRTHKSA